MSSNVEKAVLNASNPLKIESSEVVEVNGVKAVVLNKNEVAHIKDIDQYKLNEDRNPQVIKRKQNVVLTTSKKLE